MNQVTPRNLTAEEEKLLAHKKLNDAQRVKLRQVWQGWELDKAKWSNLLLFHLVNPLLIAGLIYLLSNPTSKVINLILLICWVQYPLLIIGIIISGPVLFILDINRENKADIEVTDDSSRKYFMALIGAETISNYLGQNKMKKGYYILIFIALILLLALNGAIVTAILATLAGIVNYWFILFLKARTQIVMDAITKAGSITATDSNGQVIEAELITD